MDLEDFLTSGRISPDQCSMDELLDQATNLADALDHLHNRLGVSTRGYHMDLKPANILVYEEPNPLRPHGVGTWKITDFGHSIIERPERRDSLEGFPQDPVTETITHLRQMEGTYQAPEVCAGGISRRSDVWSFGCILVRVFAFALDGIEGLHRLDRLRQMAEDSDRPYDDDYFARGNPPVLNPHIENWIRSLPHRRGAHRRDGYNDEFLNGCARLLSSTLKIDKNARPEAYRVKEALGDLKFALHRPPRPSSSLSSISEHRSEGLESVETLGSSVSAPLAPTTSGLSLGLAILTDQLIDEIKSNELSGIERVLGQNVQVDRPDNNGDTPLGIATRLGNEAVVRRLLQANASVDARSAGNKTPLMIAARNGRTQIARLLLERDPDLMAYSEEGLTCLHYATCPNVSLELFELLVSQFPNVDIPTPEPEKETPLMMLIKHFVDHDSWEAKFKKLVSAGADVNRGAGFEMTPLRRAVSEGSIRAARLLIANHAERKNLSNIPNMSHNMTALLEERSGERRRSGGRFWRRHNQ
jgi:serine/threonine protein kinase